jgi:hypothetical protein
MITKKEVKTLFFFRFSCKIALSASFFGLLSPIVGPISLRSSSTLEIGLTLFLPFIFRLALLGSAVFIIEVSCPSRDFLKRVGFFEIFSFCLSLSLKILSNAASVLRIFPLSFELMSIMSASLFEFCTVESKLLSDRSSPISFSSIRPPDLGLSSIGVEKVLGLIFKKNLFYDGKSFLNFLK